MASRVVGLGTMAVLAAAVGCGRDGKRDSTPPAVVATSPAADAADVDPAASIAVFFSEDMDPASVNVASFALVDGVERVPGTVSASGPGAALTAAAPLRPGARYTAVVMTGARDRAGNPLPAEHAWSFTTRGAVDRIAPALVWSLPVDGMTDVPVTRPLTVRFSEPLDPASVTADTVRLSSALGSVTPSSITTDGPTVVLTPRDPLATSMRYEVAIVPGVRDLAGNATGEPLRWSFLTSATVGPTGPDTTSPTVTEVLPDGGASGVATDATLSITFSEVVDPATVGPGSILLRADDGFVVGSVTYLGPAALFTPESPLRPITRYTATVNPEVRDLSGRPLAAERTWSFTTGTEADRTPPIVTAHFPPAGAEGVDVGATVRVRFDEPLDAASAVDGALLVGSAGGEVEGDVSCDGTALVFTPDAPLEHSTEYAVTLPPVVTDVAGNVLAGSLSWSFTTEPPPRDVTPPTVVETLPAAGATGVAVGSSVAVTFGEVMDPASVGPASFLLRSDSGFVLGSIAWLGRTAVFTPASPLRPLTRYSAIVEPEVRDLAGNALGASHVWSFTTGDAPDLTPPAVTAQFPAPDATEVATGAVVRVRFSEPLDPRSAVDGALILGSAVGEVSGTVSSDGTALLFTPAGPLAPSTLYAVALPAVVTDRAGNPLATPLTWSFTTAAASPPTATSAATLRSR
jgi:hypothetical protein